MSMKSSGQIRREFMDFFEKKGHVITPSAPVVPNDDPTLLFTNAGMNQFKPVFLGEEKAYQQDGKWWTRAANTQKCIRVSGKHNDLEEVGIDTYHHTLFEMLGNWSFGDYFKKEAIGWAWELLVDEWGLDPDRLYATVFGGDKEDGLPVDEEAIELWKSETGIAHRHILRFDKKDNFWEMGDTGPCGPCSEVHIDLRSDEDRKKQDGAELVNADDPRVMEIWNLVFIQFNRQHDGSLKPLPALHVDTGMGFERICAVLQDKKSNYDSDVFTPLLDSIGKLAGRTYGKEYKTDVAMRVIADHIRAVSFGIADGASPANDGRGYVIRRILRRAVRYGWDVLGLRSPFMFKLVEVLCRQFKDVFPELDAQQDYVTSVIRAEEESFLNTLGQGITLFEQVARNTDTISGDDVFKLHDTYGFPVDLTRLMARERGLSIDEARFAELMNEQKERARGAGKFAAGEADTKDWQWIGDPDQETEFIGYDSLRCETTILGFRSLEDGKGAQLILAETPFYAESGGQVGDTGLIISGNQKIEVTDVRKKDGRYVHYVNAVPENPKSVCKLEVHASKRRETQKHHTATHLMHAALREELGSHVAQKGSLVTHDRLRFDFSHFEALSQEQLDRIERRVNEKIQENIPLQEERSVPIDEARQRGAMMLFGEKYGDKVRVVTFDPDFSVELCGGTHVMATGEIGYFRFVSEASAASGIRRVEAVTGKAADALLRSEKARLREIAAEAGANRDPVEYLRSINTERKQLEKQLKEFQMKAAATGLDALMETGTEIADGITLVTGEIEHSDMNQLKQLGYDILNRKKNGTIALLGTTDTEQGKVYLMACVTEDVIGKGLKAGALVGRVAKLVGGGGGGQPNLATAGGREPEKLPEALGKAAEIIRSML